MAVDIISPPPSNDGRRDNTEEGTQALVNNALRVLTAAGWKALPKLGLTTISAEANATFTWSSDLERAFYLTDPLTADRTVTLGVAGVLPGEEILFTRAAASTGTDEWIIGSLKQLELGTWCLIKFDGSAWYLAAYGAL